MICNNNHNNSDQKHSRAHLRRPQTKTKETGCHQIGHTKISKGASGWKEVRFRNE